MSKWNLTNLPDNPYSPVVNLTVGDYTVSPKHLLAFEYDRVTQTEANTATFTLFDETAIALEYQLALGKDDLKFSYGYSGGKLSKTYNATIQDYTLEFTPTGAQLSVVALTGGVAGFSQPKTASYSKDIHQIVSEIAKEEGWVLGTIEPCKPVYSEELSPKGSQLRKVFTRNNLAAIQFITNNLIPYATSRTTGESDYQLYFDDSEDKPVVNFCSMSMKSKKDEAKGPSDVAFYDLQWGTGSNSRVLSFQPNFSGNLVANLGASEVQVSTINKLSNEMFKISHNKDTDPFRTTSGDKSSIVTNKHMTNVAGSSYSADEATKLAANMWYHAANLSYGATLNIIGDPNINPMSMISLLIVNRDGLPHHTTGIYLVTQVTDSISDGQYTTTLQLLRNGLNVGTNSSGGIDITLNTDYVAVGATPQDSGGVEGSSTLAPTSSGNSLVEEAKKYLGIPYVWGGKSPRGFDCSGFTQYVYKQVTGKDIGANTKVQVKNGTSVPIDQLQPGDLIFNGGTPSSVSHVVMYIGDGKIIHAPRTGDVVKISNKYKGLDYGRRYL